MTGLIAFVWGAMDAFYEEDEPILGHAADPYHRVDVRASSRHLTVHLNGELVADTRAPLAVFETGFAARWYVPPDDVVARLLRTIRGGRCARTRALPTTRMSSPAGSG